MSKYDHTWADALHTFGIAACIMAFFLGVGGCMYLERAGNAKVEAAKHAIKP